MAKLGYTGSHPLLDGYLSLRASGADTTVYLDPDGAGRVPAMPLALLRGIAVSQITAASFIPAP